MRKSGILLPVSSLPSFFGIGAFSQDAYDWIDFLKAAGQSYWQILPIGPVSYGDSPYQSFSVFAGNPLYISLEFLIEDGLLSWDECNAADFGNQAAYVDYGKQFENRYTLLYRAYERSGCRRDPEFAVFCSQHEDWLLDYALYMVIKEQHDWKAWTEWEPAYKLRDPETIGRVLVQNQERILFYGYLQFLFSRQWHAVKNYANEAGIKIIGDLPIYVSLDSADVWTNPELFQLTEEGDPKAVSGCPPDFFSEDGQLWGNPLYDWEAHRAQDYDWWLRRLRQSADIYDVIRIDHFRGFDEYYSIPYGDDTAKNGVWEPGPGIGFFDVVKKHLPDLEIIAEDLGLMTESVRKLVRDTGYPNMKVLQFGFDSDAKNEHLPHNYKKNCVVYTGTHDNETLAQFMDGRSDYEHWHIREYINMKYADNNQVREGLIRLLMSSVADTCIIPIQDFLGVGAEGRINTPSTLGDNWKWRLVKNQATPQLAEHIRFLSSLYGRERKDKKKE